MAKKPKTPEGAKEQDGIQHIADKINGEWKKGNSASMVQCYINTGNMLLAAKGSIDVKGINKLPHGEFEDMVRSRLDFSPSTARRLMLIANHPIISNRAHGHALPGSWRTLYELTKVDPAILEEYIKDGKINPHMERKAVPRPPSNKKRKERDDLENMDGAMDAFLKKVQKRAKDGQLTEAEYSDVAAGMMNIAKRMTEGAVVLKEQMGKPPEPKAKLPPDEDELVGLTIHMAGTCEKFEEALDKVNIARISVVGLNLMVENVLEIANKMHAFAGLLRPHQPKGDSHIKVMS